MVERCKPKKNVTIEVRLPDETKTAFMARCKEGNRTASDVIRSFIDGELSWSARWIAPRSVMRTVAGVIIGMLIGAWAAAPVFAQSHPAFEHLDHKSCALTDADHHGR